MHRKNPISVLVYNTLFPTPSPTDPPSFSAHLSKNLVGEVRIETANFYGSLDTIEARYPGLNYAFQPHRKRLGRFPHHKRLFEAFDRLGLTEAEIQGFCRWEGTLWARERYERDEGVRVVDTTGVEIGAWVDSRRHSVGFSLNARLFHAAALREASGSTNIPMDPEWEQYLKEASERGELNIDATREALRSMAGHIAQIHQSSVEAEGSEAVPQTFQAPAAPA
ncbi:hypothetical protein PtrSN002B_003114 [Pyrenophora tritici-repentis]|nr:hypothetical protein A1F94_006834 [Pyrenophora tritici-repentis]KAI0581991.1 hypothetical protein Alg130_06336 [Pyrenophora tritici-repentis]KAI0585929.1 hypothetical protein Alg215_02284 [Pyrenophora tritici-repentis]KAI0609511.1 hypothetical protein TUN205_06238 [Pyrenophora tritici-repentis]KAI1547739.1 hypothetical protein PtrSN001C_002328 [Pyrenophora tritici-repentis]